MLYPPSVKGLSQGTKLIFLRPDPQDGQWMEAQLVVNNKLCIPFSFHRQDYNKLRASGEESIGKFLERQALTYLDMYGDARLPRNTAEVA